MTAWNMEVARRYKERAEGDETVVVINRKSIQQLQQHYDNVEAKTAMGARVEAVWEEQGRRHIDQLNETLRRSRRALQPLPHVEHAQPMDYPQQGPRPLGNPAVLNPEIVAGSLRTPTTMQRRQHTVLRPQNTIGINPLTGYQRTTWCITCKYRKSAHTKEERFGTKCTRDYCGKCFQLKQYHANRLMGPLCNNAPHPTQSQQQHWYN